MRRRLEELSALTRSTSSQKACDLMARQKVWLDADSVLLYAPMAGELDVWPLLREALRLGKQALLPRYDAESGSYMACRIRELDSDIQPGQFGIREPAKHCAVDPLNRLDLALVPGLAFDLYGRRLGRGKGYYDRLLSAVRGTKCGVCFEEQLVPEVPAEPHDILLNCILTPTRWIEL